MFTIFNSNHIGDSSHFDILFLNADESFFRLFYSLFLLIGSVDIKMCAFCYAVLMTTAVRNILLVISSILIVVGFIPYLIDIVKKKTKPRVVSWLNWGILGAIAGFAALSDGQIPAAVISFASVIEVLSVVVLGLYFGDRRFEKIDVFCQLGALAGLVLWATLHNPLAAILVITFVDLVAALPTYKHIWQKPNEETLASFVICSIASALTIATITSLALSGLVYPVYLLLANTAMSIMIVFRHKKLAAGTN